jgi:diguanylate cyclase (GGDEF)-like protein
MIEQQNHPPGFNSNFHLREHVADLAPLPDEFENEAVKAARKQFENQNTDSVTGLLKQEALRDSLTRTLESLSPDDRVIVYYADLDGFKAINDSKGHAAGDVILRSVGDAYRQVFRRDSDVAARGQRENDINEIARMGGDEFANFSVLRATDQSRAATPEAEASRQASKLQESLQLLLSARGIKLSVGAVIGKKGDTARDLIVEADAAMFKVKSGGKLENLTEADKKRIREIVPYLDGIGARVDGWLRLAVA